MDTGTIIPLDHLHVLNVAAKSLARDNSEGRHNYGQFADNNGLQARSLDAWRYPLIASYRDPEDKGEAAFNAVTFIYMDPETAPQDVAVIGTFGKLYEPLPLERVMFLDEATRYRALSIVVAKGQLHRYLFLVDGVPILDPLNPKQQQGENAQPWSLLFTDYCGQPIALTRRELRILERLTTHVLPFRTIGGQRFLDYFYNNAGRDAQESRFRGVYRLDQPVGVVNFIDKLLAGAERHHAIDYKICLGQVDAIIRRRNPGMDSAEAPKEDYVDLYNQMGSGSVEGWDYGRYGDPGYFLKLLRRHTYTGAFSHPRHGGNSAAAGWAYLEETYRGPNGESCFDWRKALGTPFGVNPDYHD